MTSSPPGFLDALRALRNALEELKLPWLVIGGVAVIAHGVARYTADVDATVLAGRERLEPLFDTLARHEIRPRIAAALEFARERQVLLVRHDPSAVSLDISLAWLPFEEEAIRRGENCDYSGVTLRIARPEDLIIYKIVAARPRDLDDAERLLLLHGRSVDVGRLVRIVHEFAEALEDPTRPQTLERLLRRTRLRS